MQAKTTGSPNQDYFNITASYVRPFSDDAVIVSAVFLLAMMVFGIFSNLITIIVILKSKVLSSTFNSLIVSLCLSDLLSALISPLFLYRITWGFDEWLMPGFLCKTFWAVDTWTTYVTALHILFFAVIRLFSIKWPLEYKKVKLLHIRLIAAFIWFATFCLGFIPMWIRSDAQKIDRYASSIDVAWPACTLDTGWLTEYQLYSKTAFPILIYLPMASIAVLSPVIAGIILRHRKRRIARKQLEPTAREQHLSKCELKTRRRENHAIIQLSFITGSFFLGYVPITAYFLYAATNTKISEIKARISHWNFGMIAYILLRLSKCLNPIFYNIASRKMRRETFAFLEGLFSRCSSTVASCRNKTPATSNLSEPETSTGSNKGTMDLTP